MSEDIDAEGDPNTYEKPCEVQFHPSGFHPCKMNWNP
jgi:hypothetical protein